MRLVFTYKLPALRKWLLFFFGFYCLALWPLYGQGTVENCFNGLDDDLDGYVDCFDADCPCAAEFDCFGVAPPGIAARIQWSSTPMEYRSGVQPLVANLNPQTDQIPEVIVLPETPAGSSAAYRAHIYRGDGSNAAAPDEVSIVQGVDSDGYWACHPIIGDIDANGIPDLVVVDFFGYVTVYSNYTPGAIPAMPLWVKSNEPLQGTDFNARTKRPFLADLNGDGMAEIIAGTNIFKLDLSGAAPALQRVWGIVSGLPDGKFHDAFVYTDTYNTLVAADMLSVADCNGDPDCEGLEIVAGPAILSVDLDTTDGDGISIKRMRNLNQLSPQYTWGDGYTAVGDVNLDGIPEVVVSSLRSQFGAESWGLYIWNKNGLVRFIAYPERAGVGIPVIANVYDDTQAGFAKDFPEILIDVRDNLSCFNLNAASINNNQPRWWTLPISNMSGTAACAVFDFNGDGAAEIVYRDRNDLRILYGGGLPFPAGVDTQRNWWKTSAGTQIGQSFPIVADVDNDGQAEIVALARDSLPGLVLQRNLRVFETALQPWAPCRPIWNQFNYNPTFINDNLQLPKQQQQHWLEMPAPGSGYYPLNNQFSQVAPRRNGMAVYPLPEATVVVDSSYCQGQDIFLRLKVCNQGSAALQDGVPIRFYLTDPNATAAVPYGNTFYSGEPVLTGSCGYWTTSLPLPPGGRIWGVLNDDGSNTTPFDPATTLPNSLLEECDYNNNVFDLPVTVFDGTLDLGQDTVLCTAASVELFADPGFTAYKWYDGSTGSSVTAVGPGVYWVDAWDFCGNKFSDTLNVGVVPPLTDTRTVLFPPGQSVELGGQTYTQPGVVSIVVPAPGGCDSLITYVLEWTDVPELPCDVKNTSCITFELLGIRVFDNQEKNYRFRLTNHCSNALEYVAFGLPQGLTVEQPVTGSVYTAVSGRQYEVRHPNNSSGHSIRFKTLGSGIANGLQDVFEYSLPPQASVDYISAVARLTPQIFVGTHLNTFGCTVAEERPVDRDIALLKAAGERLQVFPNPVLDQIVIKKQDEFPETAAIFTVNGELYQHLNLESRETNVSVKQIPAGVWYIRSATGAVSRFVKL